MKSSVYSSLILLFVVLFETKRASTSPIKWATENIQEFIGTLITPDDDIKIEPEIKIKLEKGERVCSFILTDTKDGMLPFLMQVKSSSEGTGKMVLIGPINKDFYRMTIKAKLCGSEVYSRPVNLIMKVNQEAPKWEKNVYDVTINDDLKPGSRVLQVKAYEDQKINQESVTTICNYKINAPMDSPFDVDGNGVIRTTDYLNAKKHRNYVLRIAAIDCQYPQPQTTEVSVNIRVEHVCKYGWNGLYDQINYQPLSGNRYIGDQPGKSEPGIRFDHCSPPNSSDESNWLPGNVCDDLAKPKQMAVKVQLETIKDEKCDLDRRSVDAMRKSCGMNKRTVDLLPNQYEFQQENRGSKKIKYPEDNQGGIYEFDGESKYWEVPTDVLAPNHYLGNNYTVMFWMNHRDEMANKEQILCNSDGEDKNRHHYSIYLHNCKLIILSRIEGHSDQGNQDNNIPLLTPAEWRFKSPEFCDGKWHHYAVVMTTISKRQFPEKLAENIQRTELFIDGQKFISTASNFEIIDDVPMQYISSVHFTKLSVGACWLSRAKRFNQYFKGQLSSVSVLPGQRESASVLQCINQCQEHLVFSGFRTMSSRTSISINSALSMMLVKATSAINLARIIQNIGYKNPKFDPQPGPRTVMVSTVIMCSNGVEKPILVPHKLIIMVLSRPDQSNSIYKTKSPIKLSGKNYIEITNQEDLKSNAKGISLLDGFSIKDESMQTHLKPKKSSILQSCVLYPMRSLRNFPRERLTFTDNIIVKLANNGIKLEVTNDSHGLVIEGKESISIYQTVLRKVTYFNDWLTNNFSRTFKVTCTQGDSMMQISDTLEIKVTLSNGLRQSLPSPSESHVPSNQVNPTYHLDLDHLSSANHNAASSHSQSGLVDGMDESLSTVDESLAVVKMNYSNTVIIVSVVALIIVAILLMGFLRSYNHGNSVLGNSPSHMTRFSTVFSGISSGLSKVAATANKNPRRSSSSNHKRANPWVRLRPEPMVNDGFGVKMRRDMIGDDRSEDFHVTVNPLLDYEKNINLFKKFIGSASKSSNQSKSDKFHRVNLIGHSDNQSLDELPDEYDGESEDYHDDNDEKLIIENDDRDELILDDVDIDDDIDDDYDDSSNDSYNRYGNHSQNPFYQTGSSLSYQLKPTSNTMTNHNSSMNIHSNPRYSFDNFGHFGINK